MYKYFFKLSQGLKFGEFYFGFTGYTMPIRSASLPAFPFHFGTSLHSHDRLAHVLFGSLEIGLQML